MKTFDLSQKLNFEWLQTINAQLDNFCPPKSSDKEYEPSTLKQDTDQDNKQRRSSLGGINENQKRRSSSQNSIRKSLSNPSLRSNLDSDGDNFKFVDDCCLLETYSCYGSNTEETETEESKLTLDPSDQMSELSKSASSFREKWQEMLQNKKDSDKIPEPAGPIFAFEREEPIPESYQMSDDDDEPQDDDEIYEDNPIEIHGKMIPRWARGKHLRHLLKLQQKINPDTIFQGFTADCSLQEIFNEQKPRWEQRNDSGWWEYDQGIEPGDSRIVEKVI
ncbi:DNA binding / methyl-CpG binding protein isoform 1 [Histomonas meleagridis]|uniref:DNA binding / methyl-CpG binding protein isoform 1 n=1 Tax=Histomonas meleagridis TaxID=135588 RepID=UPI00355A0A3A|nr:DNA binding / methyl-CpG binding protein isoform 1 [Histomonas meleagridis]KAH0802795.1 DNA binding / methyl-CpG binding protein isoform 1 [Histomonas meleagridis]